MTDTRKPCMGYGSIGIRSLRRQQIQSGGIMIYGLNHEKREKEAQRKRTRNVLIALVVLIVLSGVTV